MMDQDNIKNLLQNVQYHLHQGSVSVALSLLGKVVEDATLAETPEVKAEGQKTRLMLDGLCRDLDSHPFIGMIRSAVKGMIVKRWGGYRNG